MRELVEQDKQFLAYGKINWETKLLYATKQLIKCYENLSRYEDFSDCFEEDFYDSSYHKKTDLQISNELELLEQSLNEKIQKEKKQEVTIKMRNLRELMKAREHLTELINHIVNIEHNKAVEVLANDVKEWREHELSKEEKERNIHDNLLLAKAEFISQLSNCDDSSKALLEEIENLEYKQPIPYQYPWEHVALSMLRFPDKVKFDYDRCPQCGNSRIRIFFYSPECTWAMMCGVGGDMIICSECKIQAEFNETIRN